MVVVRIERMNMVGEMNYVPSRVPAPSKYSVKWSLIRVAVLTLGSKLVCYLRDISFSWPFLHRTRHPGSFPAWQPSTGEWKAKERRQLTACARPSTMLHTKWRWVGLRRCEFLPLGPCHCPVVYEVSTSLPHTQPVRKWQSAKIG